MKRTQRSCVIVSVTVALVASWVAVGIGATFQEKPPTTGVYRATAYTLRGGEWEIGTHIGLDLETLPNGVALTKLGLSVAYGISDQLQLGLAYSDVLQVPRMDYGLSAKFHLPFNATTDLGIPLSVWVSDKGHGIELGGLAGGIVFSLKTGPRLAVHGGASAGFGRDGLYFLPYATADFDLFPNLKLVGELGFIPISVAFGTWFRPLSFLDAKFGLSLTPLSIDAALYLRF